MATTRFISLFAISTLLVLLSPFLYQVSAQDSDKQPSSINVDLPLDSLVRMKNGATRFYTITDLPSDPAITLLISSIPLNSTSPIVYVSKENKFPSSLDQADYVGRAISQNLIQIPTTDLKGTKEVYVGLYCKSKRCVANITFEYMKEVQIKADGSKYVETPTTIEPATAVLVSLNVPSSPDAERIVIHIDAISLENGLIPELSVSINTGNKLSQNQGELIPRHSWFEGRTIVIHKGSDNFCTDCNYTLKVKSTKYSSINIEAYVLNDSTQLKGYAMIDGVSGEKYNLYNVAVQDSQTQGNFAIEVDAHVGYPTLYVNCSKIPGIFKESTYVQEVIMTHKLILSEQDFADCDSGIFAVLVYSPEASVYSIRAAPEESLELIVGSDTALTGTIKPNERMSYDIFVPTFVNENIIISLLATQTNMTITACKFPTDCPSLFPAPHSVSSTTRELSEFSYDLSEITGGQEAVIDRQALGCYPITILDPMLGDSPVSVCGYRVTFVSSNKYQGRYTIKVDLQKHHWLLQGVPKQSSAAKNETVYFILSVPYNDVVAVTFQLTRYTGDANVYVSKTESYPSARTDDTQFYHEGMMIFKDHPNLGGTYYLAVEALEATSFSLTATVATQSNHIEGYTVSLTPGVPQRGVLVADQGQVARFYKFKLNLGNDWEGMIVIELSDVTGSVMVLVNDNDFVPLPNMYMWKMQGTKLQISSDDENYSPQATYTIGVFRDYKSSPDILEASYNILFYLKEINRFASLQDENEPPIIFNYDHILLSTLNPYHGSIKHNEMQFFEALVLPSDEGVTIYKESEGDDIDIYASLEMYDRYPNEETLAKTTRDTHKNFVEVTKQDLTRICNWQASNVCSVYIAVIPKGFKEEITYSLTMKKEIYVPPVEMTLLENGRPLDLKVPQEGGDPMLFYIMETPFMSTIVVVECPGKEIAFYAIHKVIGTQNSTKSNIEVPTPTRFHYSQKDVGRADLVIPPSLSSDMSVALSVAVYFRNVDNSGNDNFTILGVSEFLELKLQKPHIGTITEGQYVYFDAGEYEPSKTLSISVTTLGNTEIELLASSEMIPTLAHADYKGTLERKTTILKVPSTNLGYVVGVYGRAQGKFIITLLFDKEKELVELKQKMPFEKKLDANSSMSFKYYHEGVSDVRITINKSSGDVTAYVITSKKEADSMSPLPNKTLSTWSVKPENEGVIDIPSNHPQACVNCLYLVTVEASDTSSFSITFEEIMMQIQQDQRYTHQLQPYSSRIYTFDMKSTDQVPLAIIPVNGTVSVYASNNPTVNITNYMWTATSMKGSSTVKFLNISKTDSTQQLKEIWNGERMVPSDPNTLYFYFHNPSDLIINYHFFVVVDKFNNINLGMNYFRVLDANMKKTFDFLSPDERVLKVVLQFETKCDLQSVLQNGLPVTVNFWEENSNPKESRQIEISNQKAEGDCVEKVGRKSYYVTQTFTVSGKGNYRLGIQNILEERLYVFIGIYQTKLNTVVLETNTQHTMTLTDRQIQQDYEVYLPRKGSWYLWLHSCRGTVDFSMETGANSGASEPTRMESNQEIMVQLDSRNGTMKYFRLSQDEASAGESQYVLLSNFFHEPQQYYYEPKATANRNLNATYQKDNAQLLVNFEPLGLEGFDQEDEIVYQVRACNYEESQSLCNIYNNDCQVYHVKSKVETEEESLSASLGDLTSGQKHVQVIAHIKHQGRVVKMVSYNKEVVEVQAPESKFPVTLVLVVVGVVVLLIVVIICCKKLRGAEKEGGLMEGSRGYLSL